LFSPRRLASSRTPSPNSKIENGPVDAIAWAKVVFPDECNPTKRRALPCWEGG